MKLSPIISFDTSRIVNQNVNIDDNWDAIIIHSLADLVEYICVEFFF